MKYSLKIFIVFFTTLFITLPFLYQFPQPTKAANPYSLRFYGYGEDFADRITIPVDPGNQNTPADVGATDFTLEWWMKADPNLNTPGAGDSWIYGNIIFDRDIWTNTGGDPDGGRDYGVSVYNGKIWFGAGDSLDTIKGNINVSNNSWHHVAVTRNRSTGQLCIFVDGSADTCGIAGTGDISYPNGKFHADQSGYNPYLVIGAEKHDAGGSFPSFNGNIDEVRISTNRRYTGSYTVPTIPLSDDANTTVLYHFDEGTGTTAVDATGGINGTIIKGGPSNGPVYSTDIPGSTPSGPDPYVTLITDFGNAGDQFLVGDFNADGREEVTMIRRASASIRTWYTIPSTGTSFGTYKQAVYDFGGDGDQFFVGDFDGDGDSDAALVRSINASTKRWYVSRTNAGTMTFGSNAIWQSDFGNAGDEFFIGDFNGDGRDDLALRRRMSASIHRWYVSLSNGNSFGAPVVWSADYGNDGDAYKMGDFDGDGDDDIALIRSESSSVRKWYVLKSTGATFSGHSVWISDFGNAGDSFHIADVNGDNKKDIVLARNASASVKQWYVAYAQTNAFTGTTAYVGDFGDTGDIEYIGDFNGDNTDDFILSRQVSTAIIRWYGTGVH